MGLVVTGSKAPAGGYGLPMKTSQDPLLGAVAVAHYHKVAVVTLSGYHDLESGHTLPKPRAPTRRRIEGFGVGLAAIKRQVWRDNRDGGIRAIAAGPER
jgi:hypothetical protein